jgi:3-isopropylmalate dehydrogenase
MNPSNNFRIAVLPGDGIGREITQPCVEILEAALSRAGGGATFDFEWVEAGAEVYRLTGTALSAQTLKICEKADAILLAAMGLPWVRYPDGTEVAPQLDLRFEFGLYAGVRPIRAIPGVPPILMHPRASEIDFVLIRESTEGLFASRGKGIVENDREARDMLVITRNVSERLFDFSFEFARQRKMTGRRGQVTCVDKANVFTSFAFFRKIFDERAKLAPEITVNHAYIDAAALSLVLRPWDFDVLVTENMFGDILSDLSAGLIGGMGFAPSADIGDEHAVFQPAHGSAPDIAGQGKANPTAMFLSGAMMLEWLGERHDSSVSVKAGRLIRAAIDAAFAHGKLRTCEFGGSAGTLEVTAAVIHQLLYELPADCAVA